MSYDFEMVLLIPGEGAADLVERFERDEEEKEGSVDVSAEDVERRTRVVAALRTHSSPLEPFRFDHAEIARELCVSEAEARQRYQHVELNDASDGVQITVFGPSTTATIAYWHRDAKAEEVLKRVWEYLRILEKEGGYVVYDPQLGRGLDLSKDFGDVLATYSEVTQRMSKIVSGADGGKQGGPTKKPWWRFW